MVSYELLQHVPKKKCETWNAFGTLEEFLGRFRAHVQDTLGDALGEFGGRLSVHMCVEDIAHQRNR